MGIGEGIKNQFILDEAEYIRKAFEDSAKTVELLERYSLLVTGGIWSWAFTNLDNAHFHTGYIIWLPVFIQALFGFRAWCIYKDMVSMLDYLAKIETAVALPVNLGWAHFWDKNRSKMRVISGYLFWGVLQGASILIACFVSS